MSATHQPLTIGLCGFENSGKNTVADFLVGERAFHALSFADTLRALLEVVDPMLIDGRTSLRAFVQDVGWAGAESHRVHGPEVNRLLEATGSGICGLFGDGAWVDLVASRIAELRAMDPMAAVVITDVRRPEEIRWATRVMGGVLWRVERPGTGPALGHVTERAIADELIDQVITNDQSLEVLGRRVLRAVDGLRAGAEA